MKKPIITAWCVHLFTMSGAVFGFLSLLAITQSDARQAILWLILALIVDGVDGSLARKFRVTDYLPNIDGGTIDNIVDYFTYVIIPAYYIWWFELTPDGWAVPACAIILVSSQYHFADVRHKTRDHYFRGFPALWNLVIFCFYALDTKPEINLAVILGLAAATFVPMKFVHPFRVERLRRTNLAVAGAATMALMSTVLTANEPAKVAQIVLIAAIVYYLAVGLHRSLHEPEWSELQEAE